MAERDEIEPKTGNRGPLGGLGGRAAARTLRPLTEGAERVLGAALDSDTGQQAIRKAIDSAATRQVIADIFEAGLIDEVVERLLESPALWHLVDELADSPAVTAAITQQSLGFVDIIGSEVRVRSRRLDDRLGHAAGRIAWWRRSSAPPTGNAPATPARRDPPATPPRADPPATPPRADPPASPPRGGPPAAGTP